MKKLTITNYNFSFELVTMINIIGKSSSGKTTLLKYLINKIPNNYIFIDDQNINNYNSLFLKQNIASVFFDTPFNTEYVSEELIYYQQKVSLDNEECYKRLKDLINFFQIEEFEEAKISLLNIYEKMFIKILSLLILRPKILGIDNLFSYLDYEQRKKIINYAKKYKISILNVTTDNEDLLLGTHIVVLKDHLVIMYDKTQNILKNEDLLKEVGISYPFIYELSSGLIYYGLIDKKYLDQDKLIGDLWK